MGKSVAIIGTRGYPSYYGGFETAVRQLAPHLAENGWDVSVYGRSGSTRTDDPDRDQRVHTPVTRGLETKSLSTLSYGLTACLNAARKKPDVALVMNVANGYWLPILKARGIPSLVNVDGIEWDRAKWGRAAKFTFRTGAKLTARFGNELVFDSVEIARRWDADFKRDGHFIPYGGTAPAELPLEPGLEHRGYILVVARFVPENTISEFLDAAPELARRWDVVIVGSSGYGGDLDERVGKLAEENPRITWLGHLSDDRRLLALWQHAGAYFHGHSVGGTNPALVQAMACGAPTVARDTVYNREVAGPGGLFAAPTATSILSQIERLMDDPGRQLDLSKYLTERAATDYSWHSVNTGYENALAALAERRAR
ncbi:glycosyltransferase [Nakamurella silvestris]|nr:glycosyltransferase [Nakamurella silvestris]